MEHKRTMQDLQQMQSLPLSVKIQMTKSRIREWVNEYGEDGVYVSFSGGKDSTVLLDIARSIYPNIKAMFVDVPTQYPELKEFVETFDNVDIVKPKMNFMQVCEKYGFPFISKVIANDVSGARRNSGSIRYKKIKGILGKTNDDSGDSKFNCKKYEFFLESPFEISDKCCTKLKEEPAMKYSKQNKMVPILAQMASESRKRTNGWLHTGCNAFESKHPQSNPMAFWLEQDVLTYIYERKLPICSVYGDIVRDFEYEGQLEGQMSLCDLNNKFGVFDNDRPLLKTTGCSRTGCVLCGFGCHLEKEGEERFLLLKETHPKFHNMLHIAKNNGITYAEAIDWINEHGNLNIKY